MQPLFRTLAFGAVLTLGFYAMSLSAQGTDPANGTWELNLAKSTFSPGPPPKSQTRTYEVSGGDVKCTLKGIDAEGKPMLVQYNARYDGKDYPVTDSQDFDAMSLTRVDAVTARATLKKGGEVVQTATVFDKR